MQTIFNLLLALVFMSVLLTNDGAMKSTYNCAATKEPSSSIPIANDKSDNSNIIGNTNNGGAFYLYGDVLYGRIVPAYDGRGYFHLSKRAVNSECASVIDDSSDVGNVVVYDGYIYYQDMYQALLYQDSSYSDEDIGAVYRVSLDGTEKTRITDELVSVFYISNNLLYFQVGNYQDVNGDKTDYKTVIYSSELDGSDKRAVYKSSVGKPITSLFYIDDDNIVFVTDRTGLTQYSIARDDVSIYTELIENESIISVHDIIPKDNGIYLSGTVRTSDFEQPNYLYRIDISKKTLTKISQKSVGVFCVFEQNLVFGSEGDIYNLSIETGVANLVAEQVYPESLMVIDETVFFLSRNTYYTVLINGGDVTPLYTQNPDAHYNYTGKGMSKAS